jgi:antitoxin YefM
MDNTITVEKLKKHQKTIFDHICENHEVLLATRPKGENIIIMAESDYLSLSETAYLLRSPKNRQRLMASLPSKGKLYSSSKHLFEELVL